MVHGNNVKNLKEKIFKGSKNLLKNILKKMYKNIKI